MQVSRLNLQNFRSYPQVSLEFKPGVNIILGPNGSGKTNILESIFFLSGGKSFRSSSSAQLISWDQSFTTVTGHITGPPSAKDLEVQLIRDQFKRTLSRKFMVDHVLKTRKDYLGLLKVVVFDPEDIRLVTGSPTRRRDYLDSIFASTEWRYAAALSQFNRALKHRNELLDLIRDGRAARTELFYWDQSLIKNSEVIGRYRLQFVRSANSFFQNHPHPEIKSFFVNYQQSVLSQDKIDSNLAHELARGYTQFGSHRDDFSLNSQTFTTSDKNLAFWGSRGQQRLGVLALRLAQINYLEEVYHEQPVLLLDDIFSELDEDHRHLVAEICRKYQTIFTSSEENSLEFLPDSNLIRLS